MELEGLLTRGQCAHGATPATSRQGEEGKKQWGPGQEGYLRQGNGKLPEERPGPVPSWLACRHQLGPACCRWCDSKPFP
ncbi:hypothetical protein EI555_008283, partial [Monodon monoceros]